MLPVVLPPVDNVEVSKLESLKPFMKNINCKVIVLKKLEETPTKDDHLVCTFKVADESGSAILTLWDQIGTVVKNGDILLIAGGFVTMFQNEIRLACKLGTVIRLGRFSLPFTELPDHSSFSWISDPENPPNLTKQVPDGKRPRSRTKTSLERARKDPRRDRHSNAPDQSAFH